MKKHTHIILLTLLVVLLVLVSNWNAMAWKEPTHAIISLNAAKQSILNDQGARFLSSLGLTNAMKHPLTLGAKKRSIEAWIQDGSQAEDAGLRARNHFHNPLKDWSSAEFSDFPPGEFFPTESSILWAQDGPKEADSQEGDWSWATVRGYYYLALTAVSKKEREEYFARTFKGIGHQIHLIQDASSPKHVRNVFHLDDAAGGTDKEQEDAFVDKPEGTFLIETWTARKGEPKVTAAAAKPVFPEVSLDAPAERNDLAKVPITQFTDANIYTGANPSAGLAQGLAEYSNANFFGKYPEFPEDLQATDNHYFPYPKKTSTDVDKFLLGTQYPRETTYRNQAELSFFIAKTGDGETVDHFIRPTYHYRDLKGDSDPHVFSKALHMDDVCHGDYVAKLVPRAVGYSASLIDYFFRGRINVKSVSTTVNNAGDILGVDLLVKNVSKLGATAEPMEGGSFFLAYNYTPPAAGADTVYGLVEGLADADSKGTVSTDSEGGSINNNYVHVRLGPGSLFIPYGSTDIYLTLVYRGKLGGEDGAVVGKGIPLTWRIAYSGQPGCGYNASQIYTIGRNGTDDVLLTNNSDGYTWRSYPSWSADGKMLAFNGITANNHYDIVVVDLTSDQAYPGNIKKILQDSAAHYITPSFNPDGTKIVAERLRLQHPTDETDAYESLVVFNVDTGSWTFLGDVTTWRENQAGLYTRWSPRGDKILFEVDNSLYTQWQTHGIRSMGYPGASQQPVSLTSPEFDSLGAEWSPDGEEIVFGSKRDESASTIWLMDENGGSQRKLTPSVSGPLSFSFSPDGRKIVFQVTGGTLYTIGSNGTGLSPELGSTVCSGTPACSPYTAFPRCRHHRISEDDPARRRIDPVVGSRKRGVVHHRTGHRTQESLRHHFCHAYRNDPLHHQGYGTVRDCHVHRYGDRRDPVTAGRRIRPAGTNGHRRVGTSGSIAVSPG